MGIAGGYRERGAGTVPLTDTKARNAKPGGKPYKLPDFDGLHLFVAPTGLRSWRLRYKVNGRESVLVLGRYPEMGLAEARRARDEARTRIRAGAPPGAGPAVVPAVPTFEETARAWHDLNRPRWKPHHAADVLASLQVDVFPAFGAEPVDQVTGSMVIEALRAMEARGAIETARRVKQRCSQVFGFATSSGWCTADPTLGLKAALAPLPPKGHRPALLSLGEARGLIAAMDTAAGQPAVKVGLRFLALTAARPGEVAGLRWAELHGLEGPAPEWRLPPERTKITHYRAKAADAHIVPLAPAVVECIEAIRPLTGRSPFVFPNAINMRRPMSENALGEMLIRLGYQGRHVPHGWRSTFSSVMNELRPADRQVIDLMLAHVPKDRVEAAYNRAKHSARRRELAEAWAALLLDGAVPAADLVSGPRRRSGG